MAPPARTSSPPGPGPLLAAEEWTPSVSELQLDRGPGRRLGRPRLRPLERRQVPQSDPSNWEPLLQAPNTDEPRLEGVHARRRVTKAEHGRRPALNWRLVRARGRHPRPRVTRLRAARSSRPIRVLDQDTIVSSESASTWSSLPSIQVANNCSRSASSSSLSLTFTCPAQLRVELSLVHAVDGYMFLRHSTEAHNTDRRYVHGDARSRRGLRRCSASLQPGLFTSAEAARRAAIIPRRLAPRHGASGHHGQQRATAAAASEGCCPWIDGVRRLLTSASAIRVRVVVH